MVLSIWNFKEFIGGSAIKRFYRLNQYIRAEKVRVVDETGEQIGVLSVGEALFKARQKGLDLVEVAPDAKPPVCKIIDFQKFKYQESKKEQAGRKKSKIGGLKEIRFTPFIAQNDYQVRIQRAKEFLMDGHKLKLVVRFVGRQITRKQFGYELLKKAQEDLSKFAKIESEPKFQGKLLMIGLAPIKIIKDNVKAKN